MARVRVDRALTSEELAASADIAADVKLVEARRSGVLLQDGHGARHRVERWHLVDGTVVICRTPGTQIKRGESLQVYRRSATLCHALHEQGTVPTAWPAVAGQVAGRAYLLERALPGKGLAGSAAATILDSGGDQLLADLARILATIHAIEPDAATLDDKLAPHRWDSAGGSLFSWQSYINGARDPAGRPMLDDNAYTALDRLRCAALDSLPNGYHLPIIHGDFRGPNLLVDQDPPKVSGIIDLELAGRGFAESDLALFVQRTIIPAGRPRLIPKLAEAYVAAANPPDGFSLRFDWQRAEAAAFIATQGGYGRQWELAVDCLYTLSEQWR